MLRSLLASLAAAILLLGLLRHDLGRKQALPSIRQQPQQLQPLALTFESTEEVAVRSPQLLAAPSLPPSRASSGDRNSARARYMAAASRATYVWTTGNGGRDRVRRKVHSGCARGNITCERAEVARLSRESEWHRKRNKLYRKRQEEQRKARKRAHALAAASAINGDNVTSNTTAHHGAPYQQQPASWHEKRSS